MAEALRDSNGYDGELVKELIGRHEEIESEIESEKGAFMAKCKNLRKGQAEILTEGKARGIPKAALKNVIGARKLQRKLDAIREELDGDDADNFDLLAEAFEGTPFGDYFRQRF